MQSGYHFMVYGVIECIVQVHVATNHFQPNTLGKQLKKQIETKN